MSSSPSVRTSSLESFDHAVPYADYEKLLRAQLPTLQKICFYDHSGRARWINDGVAIPELAIDVTKVLLQATGLVCDSRIGKLGNSITHIVAVRAPDNSVRGAIALVLNHRKVGRKKSKKLRPSDVDAALAPVLRILGREWGTSDAPAAPAPLPPVPISSPQIERRVQRDPFVGAAARSVSAPVVLRRTISNAVEAIGCAFGAVLATDRRLTVVQRGSEQQQVQAEMRHIIESLREPIAALVNGQSESVIVSHADPSWLGVADYKFVAYPVRDAGGRYAAVLVLLRRRNERDFDFTDGACLRDIAARMPSHVIDELASFQLKAPPQPSPVAEPEITVDVSALVSNSVDSTLQLTAVDDGEKPLETSVVIQTPSIRSEVSLEKRLRQALRNDAFDLHAQSIVSLRQSSQTTRCEVLLRLREQDSLQLPHTFMEAAEQGGMLPDIDRWVVGRLLHALRPHIDSIRAGRLEVALNVSGASLQRDSFGDFIEAQLFRSSVPPQALVLEFSEHDVLTYRPMFERLAPRLADLGCRVALDNCRQGLDIFLSIGRLPVHRLKIDAALTHHVTSDARAAHVVRELVEVARDIGVETVGEQVEDAATCEMLQQLGLDFVQGFTIAQPQPLIEILH